MKKSKIKVKRLLIVIAIAVLILAIAIGIIKLLLKIFIPEEAVGNLANSGLAIADGKTVYYNKYEEGIYKVKGKEETKLTDETAYCITLDKDTIYYLTVSASNTIDLKSINKNGEEQTKIASLSTPISKFYIYDDNVIYVTNRDKMRLVKMSLSSGEEITLAESGIQDFVLSKDKVFYSNNEGHLYSINLKNNETKEISADSNIKNFQIMKKWIYFYDSKENALCRIKNNGKSKQVVSTFVNNETYNVTNKNIYYFDASNKLIGKSDLKGKKSVAIAKIEAERTKINIVNGIVYYLERSNKENQLYQMHRVKTNGGATNSIDY